MKELCDADRREWELDCKNLGLPQELIDKPGEYAHWCPDCGDVPIDETQEDFNICLCFKGEKQLIRFCRLQRETIEELSKGIVEVKKNLKLKEKERLALNKKISYLDAVVYGSGIEGFTGFHGE